MTVDTLDQLDTAVVTKRKCLRIVSSQYDPLGIASPIKIILKANLKELYKLGVEWDQPLVGAVRDVWIKLFRMLVLAGGIDFKGVPDQRGLWVAVF